MNKANPFLMSGAWYKTALHMHTTRSDGDLSLTEVVERYRQRGYHVLAITDHFVISDLSSLSDENFLNIPGVEVEYGRNDMGLRYHLVVLGVRQMIQLPLETPVQAAIDRWSETGAVIILAHPYWSGMTLADTLPLQGLTGQEIFTTAAHTDLGKGLATVHWDDVLARGKHWWGFAVDDTHNYEYDFAGGWVWVKSERLEEEAILQAMKNGAFYSSSGPEIYDFRVEKGLAKVRCSEVAAINFIGHSKWGIQRRAAPGRTITEGEYQLQGHEVYLRVECVDAWGHTAWTNPVFLAGSPGV